MQINIQEPARWQKIDESLYCRKKNGRETLYQKGRLIGSGKRASVYDLNPINGGKSKALKISLCSFSVQDSEISLKVHSQGLVTGIIKPSKAFFSAGNLWITILPKYEGSLKQLLIDKKISEIELVRGFQEVLSGLIHLHQLQIAHCDLILANLLVGTWKGKRRFDIADFERSLDFSEFTKTEEFFEAFQKRELQVLCEAVVASGIDHQPSCCRIVVLRMDNWHFGRLLVAAKLHTQGKLIEMLEKLGMHIKRTKSLECVRETLSLIEKTEIGH